MLLTFIVTVPLKDKKVTTITNAFQKILNESNHNPNKIWLEKDSEYYNRSMKSWLQDNHLEIYSTHNEGKSVFAERFIETLKKKFYKHHCNIAKCVYW